MGDGRHGDPSGRASATAAATGPGSAGVGPARGRNYPMLLKAMTDVLGALARDGNEVFALKASFEAAAEGFGAQKALLLALESSDPLQLQCVHARGGLTKEQIAACEKGQSVRGVSPSVIRGVIASRRPALIEDPRLSAEASQSASLQGESYSVLCAPLFDPLGERVLAVAYFQNSAAASAYGAADLECVEGYATAVSAAFGFFLEQRRRESELRDLLRADGRPENAPELVGDSGHMQELRRSLHEVYIPALDAKEPDPILILGERGTGKDLVARYLHAYSGRREKPFVVASGAEISEELAASRFFGHKRGAFTGALHDEVGFFRAAHGGVLFLDELGDLAPRAQATLLRVLENRTVVPVGQTKEIAVDVAVVLATNRDLDKAAAEGALRRDFYDRFRANTVRILPLRERPWDIPPLLSHYRLHHERRMGKRTLGFAEEALRLLVSHAWPGNVRELARSCSVLITHAKAGQRVDRELLAKVTPEIVAATPNPRAAPMVFDGASFEDALHAFEKELILSRLERHEGNVRSARESLKLSKTTFHRYMRTLGIPTGRSEAGAEGDAASDDAGD